MSFTFSMQKILDYRAMLEEEAKVRLVKAQTMLKKEEDRHGQIQATLEEKKAEMSANMCMDAGSRWILESFIKGLNVDLAQSRLRLAQLHEILQQCKEMLLMRSKDKKVLEKLKEKQQERYYAAEKENERKFNDEAATLRFNLVAF